MPANVQMKLRTADSYALAQKAVAEMQRCNVWPTPLNFEIWLNVVGEPNGKLACEIRQLANAGEAITESKSEELAANFLPGRRLTEELREAGDQISRHLDGVTQAIQEAQRSSADYDRTLAGATVAMQADPAPPAVQNLIRSLTEATRRVQSQNSALEQRLNDSTSEVQRLQQNLDVVRRDAMTDALTNLANRKAFDEGLARAVAQADADGKPLTLAVLDIDHFKTFNDTWGHQTGDQVLRYVASVIERIGASPRLAARYGGEEFAVVMPHESAAEAAMQLSAVLVEIGSRTLKRRSTNEDLGAVTVSAGVAERRSGESASALLGRADQALYASKRGGRNRVTNADKALSAVA